MRNIDDFDVFSDRGSLALISDQGVHVISDQGAHVISDQGAHVISDQGNQGVDQCDNQTVSDSKLNSPRVIPSHVVMPVSSPLAIEPVDMKQQFYQSIQQQYHYL